MFQVQFFQFHRFWPFQPVDFMKIFWGEVAK